MQLLAIVESLASGGMDRDKKQMPFFRNFKLKIIIIESWHK